ncbi:MAG: DUF1292 domain-containing protein [Clostridia bacterium]|nr:DUF1292 domain-containing protein [Clostridia bacterium]
MEDNEFGQEIELTADDGTVQKFELLDVIDYQENTYAVLLPIPEDEEEEVCFIVLQLEEIDDEYDNYLNVDDDDIVQAVFRIFTDKNPDFFDEEE